MAEKRIEAKVLKVLSEENTKAGRVQLRVVRWVSNGREGEVKLEKRTFFEIDGEERNGKSLGLNKTDMAVIAENLAEIQTLMA